jgi:hypothetical protein
MWKNLVEPYRAQMTILRVRLACWLTKATDTHSEYVILIDFLWQKWLRERDWILRFTYIADLSLWLLYSAKLKFFNRCLLQNLLFSLSLTSYYLSRHCSGCLLQRAQGILYQAPSLSLFLTISPLLQPNIFYMDADKSLARPTAKIRWKISRLDFFGMKAASSSLIIVQMSKLSTRSITHLCWFGRCSLFPFWSG